MKQLSLLLCVMLGAPLIACAQTARTPAAADEKSPVPTLQYQSVFADYVAAKEPEQTPDRNWKRANRIVAGDSAPPAQTQAPAAQDTTASPATGTHSHHIHHEGHGDEKKH
ncbi:hypothetical protein [Massilia horti]|uniref:Lipoprotein n=1 Tax=Massilia horti TaxID=2562153 RepID=A0A4Y9T8N6_9BURK|nr:hypothetical protein [Massilia horti]TFW36153.1 hypothetical protein E4O92_00160 [Massilia horti]